VVPSHRQPFAGVYQGTHGLTSMIAGGATVKVGTTRYGSSGLRELHSIPPLVQACGAVGLALRVIENRSALPPPRATRPSVDFRATNRRAAPSLSDSLAEP
jgi:hypothetical protein